MPASRIAASIGISEKVRILCDSVHHFYAIIDNMLGDAEVFAHLFMQEYEGGRDRNIAAITR